MLHLLQLSKTTGGKPKLLYVCVSVFEGGFINFFDTPSLDDKSVFVGEHILLHIGSEECSELKMILIN